MISLPEKPGVLEELLNGPYKVFNFLDKLAQPGNGDDSGIVKTGNPLVNSGKDGGYGSAIHTEDWGYSIDVLYLTITRAYQTGLSFPSNWGDKAKNLAKAYKDYVKAHQEFKAFINKGTNAATAEEFRESLFKDRNTGSASRSGMATGEGNTETGLGGTPDGSVVLKNGRSSDIKSNRIIWAYPRHDSKRNYNFGIRRPWASSEDIENGDTLGGNPDVGIYPKK